MSGSPLYWWAMSYQGGGFGGSQGGFGGSIGGSGGRGQPGGIGGPGGFGGPWCRSSRFVCFHLFITKSRSLLRRRCQTSRRSGATCRTPSGQALAVCLLGNVGEPHNVANVGLASQNIPLSIDSGHNFTPSYGPAFKATVDMR